MRPILFLALLVFSSCGREQESKIQDFPKEGFVDVPLPLYACKQVFRRSFSASGLDKIYQELLSIPTLKSSGDRSEIENEVKTVTEFFARKVEAIINYKIKWINVLNAKTDIGDGFENSVACAQSIHIFLKGKGVETWPIKKFETEFYSIFGKYYEPTRKTGYVNKVFSGVELKSMGKEKEDPIEIDAFDRITGNNILNWNSLYFFSFWAIGTALQNDPEIVNAPAEVKTSLEKSTAEGLALYNEAATLTEKNGIFGYWQEPDSFELAWNAAISEVQIEMNACHMKFLGAQPLSLGDGIQQTCSKDANSNFAKKNALGVALHLLDLSGIAKGDGNDENALELLNLAKEVLRVAVDIGLGLSPVGKAKDIVEAVSGYSIVPPDFDHLTTAERIMCVIGAFTSGSGVIKIAAKYMKRSRIGALLFKNGAKAAEVFEIAVRDLEEIADLSSLKHLSAEQVMGNLPTGIRPYYKAKSSVVDFFTRKSTKWVRLHGDQNMVGNWVAREKDVIGLSVLELKAKFSLKYVPTHISDVNLPEKFGIRMGVVAENFGGEEGAIQFELLDKARQEFFSNTRSLK